MNKKSILEKLEKNFAEVNVNTEVESKEDNGLVDMVITEFSGIGKNKSEVLGEIFFMPQPISDPRYEMLTISLTIENEYDGTNLDILLFAMNYINFNLPFGSFILDGTGTTVVLKHVVTVKPNADEDEVIDEINYAIANCLGYVGLWMDTLSDIMNGKAGMDEVLAVLKDISEE